MIKKARVCLAKMKPDLPVLSLFPESATIASSKRPKLLPNSVPDHISELVPLCNYHRSSPLRWIQKIIVAKCKLCSFDCCTFCSDVILVTGPLTFYIISHIKINHLGRYHYHYSDLTANVVAAADSLSQADGLATPDCRVAPKR